MKDPSLSNVLIRWIINSAGVLVATNIVPGLEVSSWPGLFVAALVLGLLNVFVRPVLTLISLPLVVMTLGLFLWVINALLLCLVAWLVKPFTVASFWSALGGAAVISVTSWLANAIFGLNRVSRPAPPPPRQDKHDAGGPVIDV